MGYSYSAINKIIDNASFFKDKKILTLGTLYPFLNNNEINRLAKRGLSKVVPKEKFSKYLFVELLGAEVCHSLDVSDYQQSEIICNLNFPLPDELVAQYDVIIDAGTLEHLSNLSIALTNLFKLLKGDGIYYFAVPCNNWVDHGFFQFSPTFFIDMCIDNPNLELSDLHLSLDNKIYNYLDINAFFRHALYTSGSRINVGGVIKKLSGNVNLNLTQSKYRQQYADKNFSVSTLYRNQPMFKKMALKIIMWFSVSKYIPLSLKGFVLNQLYKFK